METEKVQKIIDLRRHCIDKSIPDEEILQEVFDYEVSSEEEINMMVDILESNRPNIAEYLLGKMVGINNIPLERRIAIANKIESFDKEE
jgi:hypothetical protein